MTEGPTQDDRPGRQEESVGVSDIYQDHATDFAEKNGLNSGDSFSQMEVCREEIEELDELLKTILWKDVFAVSNDSLAEEMADVIFTVHLLADLLDIDLRRHYCAKARYNLLKTATRDANGKITDDVGGEPDAV